MGSNLHGRRGVEFAKGVSQSPDERQHLLAHEDGEEPDGNGCYPRRIDRGPSQNSDPHDKLPVYTTIHRIRRDVVVFIDEPYSLDQLKSPRINESFVRPLVDQLYDRHDVSVVFCLLVNRLKFQWERTSRSVNATRANLCELVATKVLRRFNEDSPGPKGLLLLANVLVAGFEPFHNAPEEVFSENSYALHCARQARKGYQKKLTALELAILSDSKHFLSSSGCQRVVDAIYVGRIVYTPTSFVSIIPDHYKHQPVSLYEPRKASILNQYRLIVPRTRNFIEVTQFVVLLVLYFLVLGHRTYEGKCTIYEYIFLVYAFGWVLDQLAAILEHGWRVYTQNIWSFLDAIFATIYSVYLGFRVHSFIFNNAWSGVQALNVLAMGAPILVPRLAFNLMSENMLFVSLQAMMADFAVLSVLAVWCFAGFLLAMRWLGHGQYGSITISKWMVWIWFGLDGTGIERSVELHWLLGPVLMILFALLGNTLFLTILVSMLSNTFSTIVSNAAAEIQFRRAVRIFEGVKSDAIFAYQPPFNILALFFILPLKYVVSPRLFHTINVALVRMINGPLLFSINAYERRKLWKKPQRKDILRSKPSAWDFSRFWVHGDVQAVFEAEPPNSIADDDPEGQGYNAQFWADNFVSPDYGRRKASIASVYQRRPSRRDSVYPENLTDDTADLPNEDFGGARDITNRLVVLEKSMERIERMLKRVCVEFGDEELVKRKARRENEDESLG